MLSQQKISRFCAKIIEFSFYALFFITPFIFNPANSELFEMPKMHFIYALTAIIVSAWLLKSTLHGKLIFKRSLLDLPLLLFLLSQLFSTYFSIDQHTSIFGYYSRINGGLLSTLAYLILYWAYVSNMNIKSTVSAVRYLLFSATLVAIWGILEHFGYSPSCLLLKGQFSADCWVQDVQTRVFATLGQPNWIAAWLVAIVPLAWVFSNMANATRYILPIVLLLAIFFTKSRSGFLGLAVGIATFVFFLLPQKRFLRLGYLILVILSGIILWQYSLADCFDLNPNQLTTSAGTESCKIRTIVWKGALDIWRNNPIFGTGPETFAYSYYNYRPVEHNNTSEWELLYNKAHNEYLNFAANTGTVGLLTYFILIISMFRIFNFQFLIFNKNFKFQISNLQTALLSGFVSILVTNFFGFSISVVNLLFFLYPAMAVTVHSTQVSVLRQNLYITFKKIVLLLLILGTTSWALFTLAKYWQADTFYSKADKNGRKALYQEAAKEAKNALFARSDEPLYYNELAEAASFLAVSQHEIGESGTSLELSKLAIDSSAVATQISPYNINFLKNRSLVFARLSLIDPVYINQAIPPLEQAVKLAPTDPKILYNLGVLYERQGEKEKAVEIFKKASELKSDYQDPKEALKKLQIK